MGQDNECLLIIGGGALWVPHSAFHVLVGLRHVLPIRKLSPAALNPKPVSQTPKL